MKIKNLSTKELQAIASMCAGAALLLLAALAISGSDSVSRQGAQGTTLEDGKVWALELP